MAKLTVQCQHEKATICLLSSSHLSGFMFQLLKMLGKKCGLPKQFLTRFSKCIFHYEYDNRESNSTAHSVFRARRWSAATDFWRCARSKKKYRPTIDTITLKAPASWGEGCYFITVCNFCQNFLYSSDSISKHPGLSPPQVTPFSVHKLW